MPDPIIIGETPEALAASPQQVEEKVSTREVQEDVGTILEKDPRVNAGRDTGINISL